MPLQPFDLARFPIHLGLGATAEREPEFTGEVSWYQGYGQRHAADGDEGRLVALHTFSGSWSTWEMHPRGAEVVAVVSGALTLVQEIDGQPVALRLEAGQAAINPPGVWHTADIEAGGSATALFITAGAGTQMRPR